MRALVYSDLQAGESHLRLFNDPTTSLQLHRVRKFYRDVAELGQREGCEMVWDLGDTTDDRSAIPISTLDAVLEGIDRLPSHDWNTKLIGNHEQMVRSGQTHVGRMFDRKFSVVDTAAVYKLSSKLQLVCAAFPADDAELSRWLKDTLQRGSTAGMKNLVLGHFQVLGCQLNSGQSTVGVPRQVLDKADLALLGHVHRHQRIGSSAFYVGSPFEQDFGESGEPKRVAVVDTESCTVEWHELPGFPVHRVVELGQFCEQVNPESENRFRVVLRTLEETERFYAHPLSNRAEPIYDYGSTAESGAQVDPQDERPVWTLDRALSSYVETTNLSDRGIQVGREDLLEFGLEIARGAESTAA